MTDYEKGRAVAFGEAARWHDRAATDCDTCARQEQTRQDLRREWIDSAACHRASVAAIRALAPLAPTLCVVEKEALETARKHIAEARRRAPMELAGNSVWPSDVHTSLDAALALLEVKP